MKIRNEELTIKNEKRAVGGVISESCFTNLPTLLNTQKKEVYTAKIWEIDNLVWPQGGRISLY